MGVLPLPKCKVDGEAAFQDFFNLVALSPFANIALWGRGAAKGESTVKIRTRLSEITSFTQSSKQAQQKMKANYSYDRPVVGIIWLSFFVAPSWKFSASS